MSGLWRGWISLEGGNGLYTGSFSLWNGDSGLIDDPVEGAAPVLTAPTLTLTSDVGRRPVTWNSSADDTIFAGYVYRLQVATNSDRTGIVQDISHDIVGGELNGASSSYDLSGDGYSEPPVGTFYYFARYERDDGEVSAWAGPMTVVVYDFAPTAFSFTDETGLALSTLETSNSITVLGVSAAAVCNWTVTGSGFEAQVNGAGAWATSGTCELNDTIQLRGTTSATNSTALNGVLDIEGVTDTWTITTVASSLVDGTQGSANSAILAAVYFTVSGTTVSSITGKNKNVSSVTRIGTGAYRIEFASALANNNYGVLVGGKRPDAASGRALRCQPAQDDAASFTSYSTTTLDVYVKEHGSTSVVEPEMLGIVVFDPASIGSDYLAAVSWTNSSPWTSPSIALETNVASLTRNLASSWRFAFDSALPDADYQVFGTAMYGPTSGNYIPQIGACRDTTGGYNSYSTTEFDFVGGILDVGGSYDNGGGSLLFKNGAVNPRGTLASVQFHVDGTTRAITILDSWNVASVTRHDDGRYLVTFDTELSDAEYTCFAFGRYHDAAGSAAPQISLNNDTTDGYNAHSSTEAEIIAGDSGSTSLYDCDLVSLWFVKPWLM